MFTFFGLFADPTRDLPEQLSRIWPGVDVVTLHQPISAIGVRFGQDRYEPALEDIPELVIQTVERLSLDYPACTRRWVLLRETIKKGRKTAGKPNSRNVGYGMSAVSSFGDTKRRRQFIASLVIAKALGFINHRWSYAFIELVGKMR
jgi:hypothetical protein